MLDPYNSLWLGQNQSSDTDINSGKGRQNCLYLQQSVGLWLRLKVQPMIYQQEPLQFTAPANLILNRCNLLHWPI